MTDIVLPCRQSRAQVIAISLETAIQVCLQKYFMTYITCNATVPRMLPLGLWFSTWPLSLRTATWASSPSSASSSSQLVRLIFYFLFFYLKFICLLSLCSLLFSNNMILPDHHWLLFRSNHVCGLRDLPFDTEDSPEDGLQWGSTKGGGRRGGGGKEDGKWRKLSFAGQSKPDFSKLKRNSFHVNVSLSAKLLRQKRPFQCSDRCAKYKIPMTEI